MTSSRHPVPRLARRWTHLAARTHDLVLVQRASASIADLGRDLDRRLANELRPEERLRMLRETTNHITRTANDAVQAYQRASRAVTAELAKPHGDTAAAHDMRDRLQRARRDVLRALDVARRRYPPADDTETDGPPPA